MIAGATEDTLTRARALVTALVLRLRRAVDLWYMTAATVVNLANFAFYGLVGHILRPAAYGAAAALLNVVSVAAIPLNAVQAAVVREVVLQARAGVPPAARRTGTMFAVSALAATVELAGASPLAERFFGWGRWSRWSCRPCGWHRRSSAPCSMAC